MRLNIKTTSSKEVVPFNYQQKLIGVLHKWLGKNNLHDRLSLYSFSWLQGGFAKDKEGLIFRRGASWFISFYEDDFLIEIINTIMKSPEMFCGIQVAGITIQKTPDLSNQSLFKLASPILIKRMETNGNEKHYTYENNEASELMKETIQRKMQLAGLDTDDTMQIYFDTTYSKRRTKVVEIHQIKNRANMCPVIINAKPETKQFIWLCGVGNSTGSGFGSIY